MFRSTAVVTKLMLLGLLATAGADSRTPTTTDPQAMAALVRVQKTMIGLSSYQAECDTTFTYPATDGKAARTRRETSLLKAVKPNLMWYVERTLKQDGTTGTWARDPQDAGIIFVCDGNKTWKQFGSNYRVDRNTGPEYQQTVLKPWGGFYSASGTPASWIRAAQKDGGLLELRRDGQEVIDGTLCDKVADHLRIKYGDQTQEYWETWFIGSDGLMRRRVQRIEFNGKPGFTREDHIRRIVMNRQIAAKTFTYAPGKGVELEAKREQSQLKLLTVGMAAPDFTANDQDNKPVKPSDFKGKVVVLDFWASWCPPCRASMPYSQEVTKKLQAEGLPVVLLAVDNSEDRSAFSAWVAKNSPTLPALIFVHIPPATDVIGKLYHVSGIPTQYVLDENGTVRAAFVGYGGPTDDLEKAVRSALKQP